VNRIAGSIEVAERIVEVAVNIGECIAVGCKLNIGIVGGIAWLVQKGIACLVQKGIVNMDLFGSIDCNRNHIEQFE